MRRRLRAARVRLSELADALGGKVVGRGDTVVTGVSSLEQAGPGDLSWIENPRGEEHAQRSRAAAFLVSAATTVDRPQVIVAQPRVAMVETVERYFLPPRPPRRIARLVSRGRGVRLGPGASIAPFVTLGDRVVLGARVTLHPGVVLGDDVVVGDDCVLHANVVVGEGCRLGARVVVHAGSVIGSDGFGYVLDRGRHRKIPQLGRVTVGDDVELGANVTVDRATFGETVIGRGTKVDNLVQIAHNVVIGEHTVLAGQVGIAGSTRLGAYVVVGGQSGLTDHIEVGDGARVAAGSGVIRSVPAGQTVSGNPALPHEQTTHALALLYLRLPSVMTRLRELERRLGRLEGRSPAAGER
jgi:UDP-3-O-[3-hydroxymyristoyl] glucosamine N-acyltransferase